MAKLHICNASSSTSCLNFLINGLAKKMFDLTQDWI